MTKRKVYLLECIILVKEVIKALENLPPLRADDNWRGRCLRHYRWALRELEELRDGIEIAESESCR